MRASPQHLLGCHGCMAVSEMVSFCLEGFQFAWDFLMAVLFIVQKLAEEWPGLHVCVKTPCRTIGCPAELIWPDMDGTSAMYVHAVWLLLQCWWGWSASVKLVAKLTGYYVALLLTVVVRVPCGVNIYLCGKFEHRKTGEKVETLGLRHIMSVLARCQHVPCFMKS